MEEIESKIVNLIEVSLKPLLSHPDELHIESRTEDKTVYADITVNSDDVARAIGRRGYVIKSIRTLCRAVASQIHARAEIELLD